MNWYVDFTAYILWHLDQGMTPWDAVIATWQSVGPQMAEAMGNSNAYPG